MKSFIRFILIFILALSAVTVTAKANEELITLPRVATLDASGAIIAADFSKDDKFIATGDNDGVISIWNASSGILVTSWKGEEYRTDINKVMYSPDGKKIASSTNYGISIWDVGTGNLDSKYSTLEDSFYSFVNDIAFNKDGTILYAALANNKTVFLDVQTGDSLLGLKMASEPYSMAYNPNSNDLAIGLRDGNVNIHDGQTGAYKKAIPNILSSPVRSLAYSKDFEMLYGTDSLAYQPVILNVQQGYEKVVLKKDDYNSAKLWWNSFAFSPNNKYIVMGSGNNIAIYDTSTKQITSKGSTNSTARSIVFSHDNKRLVAGNVIYDTSVLPDRELQGISIKQENKIMIPGTLQSIGVVGVYSDGSQNSINPSEVKWNSSNSSVANFTYGKLEAFSLGKATITAEYNGFKASFDIQVQNYKEEEQKINVPNDKVWTISFSGPVNIATIREKNIYITDENQNIIPALYYIEEGNKSTVQLIPVKDYAAGKTYTLWVKDVDSAAGNAIKQYTKMNFTIKK